MAREPSFRAGEDPDRVADDEASLFQRGHPAADLLESWSWPVLRNGPGSMTVRAMLSDRVRNRRGQLFGGFTATIVDLVATAVVHSTLTGKGRFWIATTGMRLDYLAPVVGSEVVIEGRLVTTRGRTSLVDTRFLDDAGEVTVHAVTTFRALPVE
jgi:acyl-coenzyme A thioesterase PaaI-like protein